MPLGRRHAGRGHCGQAAGRADLADPHGAMPTTSCWSSERDLERAVAMLVGIEKTVVEGAGAAGLAAMLADPERYKGKKVATLLCGGNIDTHLLANVLVRDLVRQGRIARLHVAAQDQPGRARGDHRQGLRSRRQHHRDQPQPDLHRPAGQGHDDRGRMRGARPAVDRRCRRATRSRRIPRRARLARLIPVGLPPLPVPRRDSCRLPSKLTRPEALFFGVYQPHKEFRNHLSEVAGERTLPLPEILRDEPEPVPVPAGQGRAEGVHRAQRPPCQRTQRSARPDRLPPQPVGRLSAKLHRLLRLRLGPRARRRVRGRPRPSASCSAATPTSRSARASRGRPTSNISCSAAISPRAIRAAAWPRWTRATSPTWSSRRRSAPIVIEYREPSVDGRPGQARRRLPQRPAERRPVR